MVVGLLCLAAGAAVARHVHAATLNVCPIGCAYSTIQDAVTAAASGDTIAIGAGTYTITATIAVSKTLTLQGDGSYPKIFFNAGGGATNNIFSVAADNVTFRNLEIYSPTSTFGTRSNYGIYYASGIGLMVDDCNFHDVRRALYVNGGNTFTVQHSQLSAMNRNMIEIDAGTGPFVVTKNWIHDSSYLGGSTSGVLLNRDDLGGGVGEISYNYIEGVRAAILYEPSTPTAPTSGSILIAHNTIDNTWTSTSSYYNNTILTPSYNIQGIAVYDPSGFGLSSSAITIRDNIVANTRWYGTHYEGGTTGVLSGNLPILNSIYWNNYWDAANTGAGPLPNQWFGTAANPQIGWDGAGTGIIAPNTATQTIDPLFIGGARTTPSSYYALGVGSPACAAASDGKNIGAWQGMCPLPPPITAPSQTATSGGSPPASADFYGQAYPSSTVTIFRKSGVSGLYESVPLTSVSVAKDGTFHVTVQNFLQANYFFALQAVDRDGRESRLLPLVSQFIPSGTNLTLKGILIPPTVDVVSAAIAPGRPLNVLGYSAPSNTVEIWIDGILQGGAISDASGFYTFTATTDQLALGDHTVKARLAPLDGDKSDFSLETTFRVSTLSFPKTDLNGDGVVNTADWSIFVFRWESGDPLLQSSIDFNGDGKVDVSDLSILLNAMRLP